MDKHLISPHGGALTPLMVDDDRSAQIKQESRDWASWDLKPNQVPTVELLLTGALSPLSGYMTSKQVNSVQSGMELEDGTFWPLPIVLDVSDAFAESVEVGSSVTLRDQEGVMLAVLHVEDKWQPDRNTELNALFGTTDENNRAVRGFLAETGSVYLGGRVEGVQLPIHYDFPDMRVTPSDLRSRMGRRGWRRVLSFDSRSPIHRPDFEMLRAAARKVDANLLIQPSVGNSVPEDIDHFTRIRCYREAIAHYPHQTGILTLMPIVFHMAGVREVLLQAIVRKNFGATHFLFHPVETMNGDGNLTPSNEDVQAAFDKYADELGIQYVPYEPYAYVQARDAYLPMSEIDDPQNASTLTDAQVRNRLHDGREIPTWFTYPEVLGQLVKTYPPRDRQGFTVFFTGLSGSGKSTVANALLAKLLQIGGRPVTLLDGDIVRKNLSSELGFSKEHRDINIRRIGYVASEITKNRGIAICAPIAPYNTTRQAVRNDIEPLGGFILVHVDTPIEVCEQRDRKGLYAKARAGIIKEFTGISDPYDVPEDAEITINTTELSPEEAVHKVLLYLSNQGYIGEDHLA